MQSLAPRDEADLVSLIGEAVASNLPLLVAGAGSRARVGRPVEAEAAIDLSALTGVIDYDPTELMLVARAATPLAEIEALVASQGQMLAFEPPHHGALCGRSDARATIGGAIAANAGGPRRFSAGAARDHLLGFQAVSGRGDAFQAGGRVVKNVTGFDLCKVMAGSWGTLAVMTEVCVKVLPRPRTARTLLIEGLDASAARVAMARACGSAAMVSGAAWLSAPAAIRIGVGKVSALLLRIEGFESSVAARVDGVRRMLGCDAPALDLIDAEHLWRQVGAVADLLGDGPIWRCSGPATGGAALVGHDGIIDWAGSLVWRVADDRPVVPGGHATLWRGDEALRQRAAGAPPGGAAREAITARLKTLFDPADILNRGRLRPPLAKAA